MDKKMISKKPERLLNHTLKIKLKRKAISVSSAKRLTDQELIFNALWQCLIEQDLESFKEILKSHIDAVNKTKLASKSKTSRRTLHRILSAEGNPTLKSVSKVLNALYG